MKSLYEFIIESREYFDTKNISLDFLRELFTKVENWIEIDKKTMNKIQSVYPYPINKTTVYAILDAWLHYSKGMNGKYTDEGAKKFLELLSKQPIKRLQNVLGTGSEGLVFNLGDNRILKVFYENGLIDGEATIIQYKNMVGKKFQTLPHIYKVTDKYVIREDITPDTPKTKNFYKVSQSSSEIKNDLTDKMLSLEQVVARHLESNIKKSVLNKKQKEVLDWLITCRDELESIGCHTELNLGDFRLGNIGEAKDGRIVYFDW